MRRSLKPTLAKLTRPRLHQAVVRERLFNIVAGVAESCPVLWVSGPPGAGKTTLLASYAEHAGRPCLWYQTDSGDQDVTAFFRYVSLAASALLPKGLALPPLTGDIVPDPLAFGRALFRELFSATGERLLFVLDNYQEVPENAVLHAVVKEAIGEIPAGANLAVLSRALPPAAFARHRAHGSIGEIGFDLLRVTDAEALEVARARGISDAEAVKTIRARTDGWIAGVNLMLEHARSGRDAGHGATTESLEDIFHYFAGEIFDAAPAEDQQTLVQAAFLPLMTAKTAERITANPRAVDLLDALHRRQMFVDRRPGDPPTYHFHALFREFLLVKARETFTPAGLRQLRRRAAALLEEANERGAAVDLYLEAEDWGAAARLIEAAAPEMYASARWTTLLRWIGGVPTAPASLTYWRGMAEMAHSPVAAESLLDQAFAGFAALGEREGQILACAGAIRAFHANVQGDFPRVGVWIERLTEILQSGPPLADAATSMDTYAALTYALQYCQPAHPFLPVCHRRLMRHLTDPGVASGRKSFAAGLAINFLVSAEAAEDLATVLALSRPVLERAATVNFTDTYIWNYCTLHAQTVGRFAEARVLAREIAAIAERFGLERLASSALWFQQICAVQARDADALGRIRERLVPRGERLQNMRLSAFHCASASLLAMRGDVRGAIRHLETWRDGAHDQGLAFLEILANVGLAGLLCSEHDHAATRRAVVAARVLMEGTPIRAEWREADLIDAVVCAETGDTATSDRYLERAFGDRVPEIWTLLLVPNEVIARACALALARGIASAHARELIQRFDLRPPDPAAPWPWPLRVRTLGGFAIETEDGPPAYGQKVPRRPLQVLQAVIALGGAGVSAERVTEMLWPDLEGDAAQAALHTALYRLRKLLRRNDLVTLADGKLDMDPTRCWADSLVLEAIARGWPRTGATAEDARRATRQAAVLYRGDFLASEPEAPWVLGRREQLRRVVVQFVRHAGALLEACGHLEDALAAYTLGTEADPAAEDLYRRRIACLDVLGRRSDALTVYRQCVEALSRLHGIRPSSETDAQVVTLTALDSTTAPRNR